MSTVTVHIEPLTRFTAKFLTDLRLGRGPYEEMYKQWAFRYRTEMQERFDRFSKGGRWAPLKESTKRARRAGRQDSESGKAAAKVRGARVKAGLRTASTLKMGAAGAAVGTFTILRDTGILYAALHPTFTHAGGQLQEHVNYGIRVGFGGPVRHPGGQATIADIALFHQAGCAARNLPARPIIVEPSAATQEKMREDFELALEKAKQNEGMT